MQILIALLISIAAISMAKTSAREDIYKLSAAYRHKQPYFVDEEETKKSGPRVSQSAAQATIISALSEDYEHPVTPFIERQLSIEYETCAEALGDIVTWCLVLYGDWYGNKASNTLGYYLFTLITSKVPQWVVICTPEE